MTLITHFDAAAAQARRIARKGALALLLAFGVVAAGTVSSASAAADVSMASVGLCGDLRIKTSLWGTWARHAGCNSAEEAAISPDGKTIAVLNGDGHLLVKPGLWEDWQLHHGDTKAFALGPLGMMAHVGPCGDLAIKHRLWGTWERYEECGFASAVAISPSGRFIAVRTPNRELKLKDDRAAPPSGDWVVQDSSTDALALGPNRMMASVSWCYSPWPGYGSLRIKLDGPLAGAGWDLHFGCDLSAAAISPDGETIAALTSRGDLIAKVGLWGDWQVHHGGTRSIALGPAILPEPASPFPAPHDRAPGRHLGPIQRGGSAGPAIANRRRSRAPLPPRR